MNYDAAYMDVMGRELDGTELKVLDIYLLGQAVLNSVGMCITLGHANPANSVLDYTPTPTETDHVSLHILRDLLAWQSGRRAKSPGCEERLRAWVSLEWLPQQMRTAEDKFFPTAEAPTP